MQRYMCAVLAALSLPLTSAGGNTPPVFFEPGQTPQMVAEALAETCPSGEGLDDCIRAWVVPFCGMSGWPVDECGPVVHRALRPLVVRAMAGVT